MIMMQVRDSLRSAVAAEMKRVADAMTSGTAADYADYRRMVGALQGLRKALEVQDAVFNKLLDEQDD